MANAKDLEKQLLNASIKGNDIDILKEQNPEVFTIAPDPGHHNYAGTSAETKQLAENKRKHDDMHGPGSSWGRIQTAMQEVWRQKELQLSDSDGERRDGFNTANMLPVTLSTVIMLATTPDVVPMEYYMWTEKYLSCIKDESGHMPHNIGNMVRMIRHRCRDLGFKWDPEWGLMPPEPDDDRLERKRLERERKEAKRLDKEIRAKQRDFERKEGQREKLAEERDKARKKDAAKMKDAEKDESKIEKELKTKNTVGGKGSPKGGSPRGGSPKGGSPKGGSPRGSRTGSRAGSRRASSANNDKPADDTKSPRGSTSRQAGGGRPGSAASNKSNRDDESIDFNFDCDSACKCNNHGKSKKR